MKNREVSDKNKVENIFNREKVMFYIYTTIIFIYILLRGIVPLDINILLKTGLALILLLGTQLHFISKKTTGLMVGEYPKWILYPWEFLFASSVMLFLLTVATDILRIISYPFNNLHHIINSPQSYLYILGLSLTLGLYSLYQGIKVPKIKEKVIYINNWPEELNGFKIIQLTDLHVSSLLSKKWLEKVVSKTNKQNPDLTVITGDFIDGFTEVHANSITPLSNLRAKYGIFGVTGNHDYYYGFKKWTSEFEKNGVKLLFNESVLIDGKFNLVGVPDLVAKLHNQEGPDLKKATQYANKNLPLILLDHRPLNAKSNANYNIDLQLSGHTHGGMFPVLSSVVKRKNRGFNSGHYHVGNMQLYLSNGTGIWNGFPLRIGYNSEITLLKIYQK